MGVYMRKLLSTAVLAATFGLASTPAAAATTLTFSNACGGVCANYGVISQSYGDIAGLLDISYRSVAGQGSSATVDDAHFWDMEYANLVDVIYGAPNATLEIAFRLLDPTKQITFNSVDYAGWRNSTPGTQFGIYEEALNASALSAAAFDAPGDISGAWTPNYTSTSGFRFHFGADSYYAAIDNLTFTISDIGNIGPVPEPATWLSMILGFGLVGAAARRRKAQSAIAIV
jgi:PEP-CTERM motif